MAFALISCGESGTGHPLPSGINALDLLHEIANRGTYYPEMPVDYTDLGEEEFKIRAVVEARNIWNQFDGQYKKKDAGKYGNIDFARYGDMYLLDSLARRWKPYTATMRDLREIP